MHGRFRLRGLSDDMYRRPIIALLGKPGDWATAAGLTVEIGEPDRRRAARLTLRGRSSMGRVPGLAVSALELDPRAPPPESGAAAGDSE